MDNPPTTRRLATGRTPFADSPDDAALLRRQLDEAIPGVSSIRPADDTSQGGSVYFLEGKNELADGELAKLEGIAQAR